MATVVAILLTLTGPLESLGAAFASVFEFYLCRTTAQMRIYQAMVAIDGVRSYMYVRADNMSQAFDYALMRTNARNPQSYVEVIAAQELREPVDVYIRPVEDP